MEALKLLCGPVWLIGDVSASYKHNIKLAAKFEMYYGDQVALFNIALVIKELRPLNLFRIIDFLILHQC